MKSGEALRALAELTAYQWGMVTSAQAGARGVTRLDLSRLADAGHLERLAHGVYKDTGTPGGPFDDLRAAWLSTEPRRLAHERLRDRQNGVIFAGPSAARLHELGDLQDRRHEFVSPTRRQSQRKEIHYRQRQLDPRDIAVVEGLPAMSIECTIADLLDAEADTSHVADALRDAAYKHRLDLDRLRELLAPYAKREGLSEGDGAALLDKLREVAGVDPEALATRIAAAQEVGSRVAAKYLDQYEDLRLDDVVAAKTAIRALHDASWLDEETRIQVLSKVYPPAIEKTLDAVQRMLSDSESPDESARRRPTVDLVFPPEALQVIINLVEATESA